MATTTPEAPAKKRTLFEIGEDLLAIERIFEEAESEDGIDESVTAWLRDVKEQEEDKLDGYVALIRRQEMQAVAAKAEREQYAKIAKARGNFADRLKARLKEHMGATNQQKITTTSGRTIAIQNNGGKAPLFVDDIDPCNLDPVYQDVRITVNTEAVRAAIEGGAELAFARLGQRETSLRIR